MTPSSRTMTTTRRALFEEWLVREVVKFSAAFFTVVKRQLVVFSIVQVFFSG